MSQLKTILEKISFEDDAGVLKQLADQISRVRSRLAPIRRKLLILSGKGGVGKSTVASQLAIALARRGQRIGILDADLNGPCLPTMLGLKDAKFQTAQERPEVNQGVLPIQTSHGILLASMSFLLEKSEPVRWKGPKDLSPVWLGMLEAGVIREMLSDIVWGNLDFLLFDLPPGAAADKPPVFAHLIPDLDGALAVTTPSPIAQEVVRKSILYAQDLGIPILGLVENLSATPCPHCGHFPQEASHASSRLAQEMNLPILAQVPTHPDLEQSLSSGISLAPEHPISALFMELAQKVMQRTQTRGKKT